MLPIASFFMACGRLPELEVILRIKCTGEKTSMSLTADCWDRVSI